MKRRLDPDEVKERLFRILSDFADYCDANELRYYLCGGTLLGAIRHRGFIPWDDDIDVMMPRPDYDQFIKLNLQHMDRNYKLEGFAVRNSLYPFCKVLDLSTHVDNEYRASEKHLWIDVFPMDGLPDDLSDSTRILCRTARLRKLYKYYGAKIGKGKNLFRTITKIPIIIFFQIIGIRMITNYTDKLAHTYNFDNSIYAGDISWSLGPCERMKKDDYLPFADVEFCGRSFHAPACWDYYLKSLYGNYMQLPSEEKRINHDIEAYVDV